MSMDIDFSLDNYRLYLDEFEIQGDYLDQKGLKEILEEIEESNDQQYFEEIVQANRLRKYYDHHNNIDVV